ncbi:MAG: redox-regulated ATPase YchF [Candidatus Bathyarchaeia archaeon]
MVPLVGIVGRTNTGKSTFFSAATLVSVPIGDFPFTTREPNLGVGYIRTACVCKEFGLQDNPVNSLCVNGERLIPVELLDCPGLIRGAHKGRGLGNQFLDELRRAQALIVVCDVAGASDGEGRPCEPGSHDPVEDISIIEEEYDLWLLHLIEKDWGKIVRRIEVSREKLSRLLSEELTGLGIRETHAAQAIRDLGLDESRPGSWRADDIRRLAEGLRKISKPLLVAANKVDLPGTDANVEKLRERGYLVVPCSAEGELILRRAAEKELIEYRPGDGDFRVKRQDALTVRQRQALDTVRSIVKKWGSTGVQQAINAAFFGLLDMIVVYPVENAAKLTDHQGNVLPDAYLVPRGSTARDLAYMIHTDLGETFVHAVDARSTRRLKGDYVLQDRDVIEIVAAKAR